MSLRELPALTPELALDLQELLQRVPDSFRFARPGQHVQVIATTRSSRGQSGSVRLQIGACRQGYTMSLSTQRYGGADRTLQLAHAMVAATGLTHGGPFRGPRKGEPNSRNKSGAGNILFRWTEGARGRYLHVRAYVDTASSGKGVRSWSVEVHGLEGALDNAIELRRAAGYTPNRERLLERLVQIYREGDAVVQLHADEQRGHGN